MHQCLRTSCRQYKVQYTLPVPPPAPATPSPYPAPSDANATESVHACVLVLPHEPHLWDSAQPNVYLGACLSSCILVSDIPCKFPCDLRSLLLEMWTRNPPSLYEAVHMPYKGLILNKTPTASNHQ